MSYKERFIETIVDNSIANDWSTAKLEWDHICSDDIPDSNCICGQCITEVWKLLLELKQDKIISEWEMYFYEDTKRKRKLSDKQFEIRNRIIDKSKDYIMRNKKKIRGINDPILFKQLINKDNMNIKQENRDQLGKFIAQQGMRISRSKHDMTFTEVFDILKETLIQIKKLKQSYER